VKHGILASVIVMAMTAMATTVHASETQADAVTDKAQVDAPAAASPAPAKAEAATPATTATVAAPPKPAPAPKPVVTAAPAAAAPTPPPAVVVPAAPAAVAASAAAPAAAAVPVAPPAAAAPIEGATPLGVRPAAKPLALASENSGLGLGAKLLAVLGIGAAAALYLRKKRGAKPGAKAPAKIDILARTGLGVRSQLVVVEVEGTRLLIGMTPNAIQTLAVLETPDGGAGTLMEEDPAPVSVFDRDPRDRARNDDSFRPANLGDRVRSLLGTDEPIRARLASVKPPPAAPVTKPRPIRAPMRAKETRAKDAPIRSEGSSTREIAGQARGLLLSVDEDK